MTQLESTEVLIGHLLFEDSDLFQLLIDSVCFLAHTNIFQLSVDRTFHAK